MFTGIITEVESLRFVIHTLSFRRAKKKERNKSCVFNHIYSEYTSFALPLYELGAYMESIR
jgi:hypothetical protein